MCRVWKKWVKIGNYVVVFLLMKLIVFLLGKRGKLSGVSRCASQLLGGVGRDVDDFLRGCPKGVNEALDESHDEGVAVSDASSLVVCISPWEDDASQMLLAPQPELPWGSGWGNELLFLEQIAGGWPSPGLQQHPGGIVEAIVESALDLGPSHNWLLL